MSVSNTKASASLPGTGVDATGWCGTTRTSALPRFVTTRLSRVLATPSTARSACILNALAAIAFLAHLQSGSNMVIRDVHITDPARELGASPETSSRIPRISCAADAVVAPWPADVVSARRRMVVMVPDAPENQTAGFGNAAGVAVYR